MKKRTEDDLLNDLFPRANEFRAASLERTLFSAARQRRQRKAVRVGTVAILCLGMLAIGLNFRSNLDRSGTQTASVGRSLSVGPDFPTVPGTSIRIVSDEELLALFADRPVAFSGPPEDRQFIVLDEARSKKTDSALN